MVFRWENPAAPEERVEEEDVRSYLYPSKGPRKASQDHGIVRGCSKDVSWDWACSAGRFPAGLAWDIFTAWKINFSFSIPISPFDFFVVGFFVGAFLEDQSAGVSPLRNKKRPGPDLFGSRPGFSANGT